MISSRRPAKIPITAMTTAVFFLLLVSSSLILSNTYPLFNAVMPHARPDRILISSAVQRKYFNLVYWSPERTNSKMIRTWLKGFAADLKISTREFEGSNPFEERTDWHTRSTEINPSTGEPRLINCTVLMGRIRTIPLSQRRRDTNLGVVVTSIREPLSFLADRYFLHSGRLLKENYYKDKKSKHSRYWFFYFNDLDPCEYLRYYDGEEGCDLDNIEERVHGIVSQIDCVISGEEPAQDLKVLCKHMGGEYCSRHPTRVSNSKFVQLLDNAGHLREPMRRVLNVTMYLHEHLSRKRCRHFKTGGEFARYEDIVGVPRFPFETCSRR